MNYLIFEYKYEGHYVEYIRYLLTYAENYLSNAIIHLVLSSPYKKSELPQSKNFLYHYLTEHELNLINKAGKLSIITRSYYRCKILSRYILKYNIDKIILLNSIDYIFGLSLFTPKNSNFSAIEYIIPRWRPTTIPLSKRIEDRVRLWLYSHTPQLRKLLLLNDEDSAKIYNQTYKCSKFHFLPDPIATLPIERKAKTNDKIVLLHAGRFRKEKGTFEIIESLKKLLPEEREKFKFILCGGSEIKEDFTRAAKEMEKLKKLMEVEFFPGFVKENFLHQLYMEADLILIPYHNYFQSSGNLGHAASYGKPVIGPGQGLLGYLIRKYKLGYTLKELNSDSIASVLRFILANKDKLNYNFEDYVRRCSPKEFARIIFN